MSNENQAKPVTDLTTKQALELRNLTLDYACLSFQDKLIIDAREVIDTLKNMKTLPIDISGIVSKPVAAALPASNEDLLDIVRTLVCIADRMAGLTEEQRELYPSPTSDFSPLMQAARRACVERGYTEGGLAVEGVAYPDATPALPVEKVKWLTDGQRKALTLAAATCEALQIEGVGPHLRAILSDVRVAPGVTKEMLIAGVEAAKRSGFGMDRLLAETIFKAMIAASGGVPAPALPVVPEGPSVIGKLLDAFSEIEHLWGLNEPGALVRHRDVFNMIVKIGKEQVQRESMRQKFASRTARPATADFDLIAQNDMVDGHWEEQPDGTRTPVDPSDYAAPELPEGNQQPQTDSGVSK